MGADLRSQDDIDRRERERRVAIPVPGQTGYSLTFRGGTPLQLADAQPNPTWPSGRQWPDHADVTLADMERRLLHVETEARAMLMMVRRLIGGRR